MFFIAFSGVLKAFFYTKSILLGSTGVSAQKLLALFPLCRFFDSIANVIFKFFAGHMYKSFDNLLFIMNFFFFLTIFYVLDVSQAMRSSASSRRKTTNVLK